jgi:hypothetical protein
MNSSLLLYSKFGKANKNIGAQPKNESTALDRVCSQKEVNKMEYVSNMRSGER